MVDGYPPDTNLLEAFGGHEFSRELLCHGALLVLLKKLQAEMRHEQQQRTMRSVCGRRRQKDGAECALAPGH